MQCAKESVFQFYRRAAVQTLRSRWRSEINKFEGAAVNMHSTQSITINADEAVCRIVVEPYFQGDNVSFKVSFHFSHNLQVCG